MTTFEPWAIGDTTPNPESNSATTAVLKTNIETLIAAKTTIEIASVKAAFELVIAIPTLVRVRVPALSLFLHPFISDTSRTR